MNTEKIAPLISIIVPIYAVEAYLDACVKSVLNQSYGNLEVILVNDGSPDGCGAMCDSYQESDSRIVVIHKKNGGLSDARNAGLDICKGDFIAFVDSDDVLHSKYVEVLLDSMGGADIAYCNYELFSKDSDIDTGNVLKETIVVSVTQQDVYRKLTDFEDTTVVVAWNKLYKRHLWENLRYKVGVLHEDEYIIHHLIGKSSKIAYNDNVLIYYRQRQESITSNKKNSKSFLDKYSAYYDRYLFFKSKNLINEATLVLSFVLSRSAMKTVSKDHFVWQQVGSLKNILFTPGPSLGIRIVLLMKRNTHGFYRLLTSLKEKI